MTAFVRKITLGIVLLCLLTDPAMAGRRKRQRQEEAAQAARRAVCLRRVAAYGLPILAATALLAYSFGFHRSTPPVDQPPRAAARVNELELVYEDDISHDHFVPSAEHAEHLRALRKGLVDAGEVGVTDLSLFPALQADPEMSEIWKMLEEKFGYRIIGRAVPAQEHPGMYIPAMSNPERRIIVVNIEAARFHTVEPSFALVNEFYDLQFHHRMLDVDHVPPMFNDPFRLSVDDFFARNPDLKFLVPEDLEARSKFILFSIARLWMEKRSYLKQYDWYVKTREKFPEIVRPHLDRNATQTPEHKREHLLRHFSQPPYSVDRALGGRLWDYPLPAELAY